MLLDDEAQSPADATRFFGYAISGQWAAIVGKPDVVLSILLEKPADIDLACELVAALRSRLAWKGGSPC